GVAVSEQPRQRLGGAVGAGGLEGRPRVPVEPQPAQRVEDLLHVLGGGALPVCIFDPQYEHPVLPAREQPVVKGRPRATDVQRAGWGRGEADPDARHSPMLIGAHVSQAGGLQKAVDRGLERGSQAIQIFNQSPRMWRPTAYGEEDFAGFREAIGSSKIKAVVIHAVYLLNCASEDREIRQKSLRSLIQSLHVGAGIGAVGVV